MAGKASHSAMRFEFDTPHSAEVKTVSEGGVSGGRLLRKREKSLRASIVALAAFAAAIAALFLVSRCAAHLMQTEGVSPRRLAEGHKWPSLVDLCQENNWVGDSEAGEAPPPSEEAEDSAGTEEPSAPAASGAADGTEYNFPRILDKHGGQHAKKSLQGALKFLSGLASTSDPRRRQKAAGIINTAYDGVTVKVFIEKIGGPSGWPSYWTIEEAARRLELGFLGVVTSAQRNSPQLSANTAKLSGPEGGKIIFTFVATDGGSIEGDEENEESVV